MTALLKDRSPARSPYPHARSHGGPRGPHRAEIGITNGLEFALVFTEFCDAQPTLTWELIQRRFECSRATAYRYLSAYRSFCERRACRKAAGLRA